jgi:hypothetical protein
MTLKPKTQKNLEIVSLAHLFSLQTSAWAEQ